MEPVRSCAAPTTIGRHARGVRLALARVRLAGLLRLGVLFGSAVIAPAAQAQLAVSDTGSAAYTYAIPVPPSIGGMAPNIALNFSSGGVNGPGGNGWTLQGVSAISRCPHTKAIDGVSKTVTYDANDKLCLDGQRLIQTDADGVTVNGGVVNPGFGNPFQQNDSLGLTTGWREFRTEKDAFARVRAYGALGGSVANGPAYFTVWTKNGQVSEYGVNANALSSANIVAQGRSTGVVWAVSRISDVVGNYVDFKYEQRSFAWGSGLTSGSPNPGMEWNLTEIRYAGNGAQVPTNKVVFDYTGGRDLATNVVQDATEGYHAGAKVVSVRRLAAIRTWINWPNANVVPPATAVKVKTIKLTYDTGPSTKRSRLREVRECVGIAETQCLPPTIFTYSSGGNEAFQPNAVFAANSQLTTMVMQSVTGSHGILLNDFNGDGKTDILRWGSNPADNRLLLSNGDGNFTQTSFAQTTPADTFFKENGCYTTMVIDIDGDGVGDLFRYSGPRNLDGGNCSSYGPITIYKSSNGTLTPLTYTGPTLERSISGRLIACTPQNQTKLECNRDSYSRGANFFFLDVDADGKPDLITTERPAQSFQSQDGNAPCQQNVCTRVYKGNGTGGFSEIASNLARFTAYYEPTRGSGLNAPRNIRDANGDGLQDIVGVRALNPGAPIAFRSRGDGNFDAFPGDVGCANPIDFNGDGRPDCLLPGPAASNNKLLVSTGSTSQPPPFVAAFNLTSSDHDLEATTAGFSIVDFNLDGKHDIIRWRDDAALNRIYLSNGDGTFSTSTTFNLNTNQRRLKKSDGTADFVVDDFKGNGSPQILRLRASPNGGEETTNQLYEKMGQGQPDQLISVVSPTGLATTLTWVPLSASASGSLGARYVSDRWTANAASLPRVDITAPIPIVATVTTDSGVGGARVATEYRYTGLKAATDGRGLLGFREVRRQRTGPDGSALTTVTVYEQRYPYTGTESQTETYRSPLDPLSGALLSRSVYLYCDTTALPSAAAAAATALSSSVSCPVTAKVQRPYLLRTVELGWELNTGSALPMLTTTNSYNSSGDPTSIVVQATGSTLGINQTVTKTTTNTYQTNDTSGDSWILGRLQRATQQNTVPNSLGAVPITAGNAPFATATVGTGPAPSAIPQPISPAVLAVIWQLLLD